MRTVLLAAALLSFTVLAGADITQNSPSQGQDQAQGQAQGQAAIAAQGQLGIVGQKSSNAQSTTINQGGDETKVNTAVWPITPSTNNKEEKALYSLFGGLGSNKTEEFIRIQQAMQVAEKLHNSQLVSDEDYKKDMEALYKQLKASLRPQKLLGFIPVAERGCSVINACGLLNW